MSQNPLQKIEKLPKSLKSPLAWCLGDFDSQKYFYLTQYWLDSSCVSCPLFLDFPSQHPDSLFEKLTTTPHNPKNPQEKFLSLFTSLPLYLYPFLSRFYPDLFPFCSLFQVLTSFPFFSPPSELCYVFVFRVPVWQQLWLLGYSQTHSHSSIVFLFVRVHGRIFSIIFNPSSNLTHPFPCHQILHSYDLVAFSLV